MISSSTLVPIFLISILGNCVAIQREFYGPPSNYISNSGHPKDNCCIIPTCDDSGHCYDTLSCGYVCSHGRYRSANSQGFTPGYRLKEYYMKEDCRFGECKMYRFLCDHCPNPKDHHFSIYTVRKDCENCYSYM